MEMDKTLMHKIKFFFHQSILQTLEIKSQDKQIAYSLTANLSSIPSNDDM